MNEEFVINADDYLPLSLMVDRSLKIIAIGMATVILIMMTVAMC